MAEFYKVLKADPLGDPWTPNKPGAKPIQNYWCQVEGEELAVSVGKQVGNELLPGQHIYGDLIKARSQKGTDYWKFKGEQVPDDVQRPASTPAQAQAQQATGVDMSATMPDWFQPWANLLQDISKDLKALKGEDEATIPGVVVNPKAKPAEKLEQVDEETLEVINEIFPDKGE